MHVVAIRREVYEKNRWIATSLCKAFVEALEQVITAELGIEDQLNAEVRQMLKAYEKQIEQGQVDYQRMFTMIKTKLVRERGIVL